MHSTKILNPLRNFLPHATWQKFLLLAILLCSLAACAKPEPIVVVTVGGLGFSQMHDLRMAIIDKCPQAKVINGGAWDAYKNDIKAMATEKPHQHYILIGHSFGCEAIDKAAAQLPKVDLAIFIDPAWDDFPLASTIDHYLWFKRSGFGIEREAHIVGATNTKTINGGHNDIPHSQELITEVVNAINKISSEPSTHADSNNPQQSVTNNRSLVSGPAN